MGNTLNFCKLSKIEPDEFKENLDNIRSSGFYKFTVDEHNNENIDFLIAAYRWKSLFMSKTATPQDRVNVFKAIYNTYIDDKASSQINIKDSNRNKLDKAMKETERGFVEASTLDSTIEEILKLVNTDIFPRFKKACGESPKSMRSMRSMRRGSNKSIESSGTSGSGSITFGKRRRSNKRRSRRSKHRSRRSRRKSRRRSQ